MSSPHTWRPIFYRTRRRWHERVLPKAVAVAAVFAIWLATTWVVARMEAADAQLQAAHAAGMNVGMQTCPER